MTYTDPPNDCFRDEEDPTSTDCDPAAIDVLQVTYIWEQGALTLDIALGGPGLEQLPLYGALVGLDLDKNVETGLTANYPDLYGMAPEVEARVDVAPGEQEPRSIEVHSSDGRLELESSTLEWTLTEDDHLWLVLDGSLTPSQSFGVAVGVYSVKTENEDDVVFDLAPDGAYVVVPGGEVVSQGQ